MSKLKVHEIAKEYQVQSKDIIGFLHDQGLEKKAGSNIEDNEIQMVRKHFNQKSNLNKGDNKQNMTNDKINNTAEKSEGKKMEQSESKIIDTNTKNENQNAGKEEASHEMKKPSSSYRASDDHNSSGSERRPSSSYRAGNETGNDRRPSSSYRATDDRRPSNYQANKRPGSYQQSGSGNTNTSRTYTDKRNSNPSFSGSTQTEGSSDAAHVSTSASGNRPSYNAERKPYQDSTGERRSYQNQDSTGERKPYQGNNTGERRPYQGNNTGERRPYQGQDGTGERRPYQGNNTGERRPYQGNNTGERRPYQGQDGTGERRPYQGNNTGERRPYQGSNTGERRPYQGQDGTGERRPYQGNNTGERRPYQGQGGTGERRPYQGSNTGERRPYQGQDGTGERRPYQGQGGTGERRPYQGQGGTGERRPYQGQGGTGERRPYQGQGNSGSYNKGRSGGGFSSFGKEGFDKDSDSSPARSFARRNDPKSNEKSTIKSELSKELTKEQRAAAFSDRNRDKNKKRSDYRFEDKSASSNNGRGTKKDPNRKGAFIMPKPMTKIEVEEDGIKTISIPEILTIKELADKMKKTPSVIVKKLFLEGKIVSINQEITFEEAEEIAISYDIIAEKEEYVDVVEELMKEEDDVEETLVKRPPVVCVMGHVDHGKTSLLDAIRETNITEKEAGGITQHIGAYVVEINGEKITFLDTPGHEAFTSMRMRGAQSTDIAILVVAADDGVMPQTVEAINHAKAAKLPIIIAVNKMDKPSANMERVKQELTEHEIVAEDWGGDTVFVPVSAKTKEGIEQLLEMILLTAELNEFKANPDRNARGIVIEAELDKGRGPVATILVQKGTLHVGDNIAIGSTYGKVRAMIDHKGKRVKDAVPSTPVEILGLNAVPGAGDIFVATENEKEARNIASAYISQSREKLLADTKAKLSLDGLFSQIKAGNIKELNLIIKADVQGSVEAMKQSLLKLSNEEVAVRIIHGGVGAINESDVNLASASNAIIIGFNVRPDNTAKEIAEREMVDVKLYRVIYNAIDDVEAAMKGMLDPKFEEKVIAHAEIRQVFTASGLGSIAGSYVLDGKIQRGCSARITREGKQIYDGPVASLKRMKDDVKEVATGYECGIVFEKFNDLAEFDLIEFYMMVEVPR